MNALLHRINIANMKIRGVIHYYQTASWISWTLAKYAHILHYAGYKALKEFGGKWTPANHVDNLLHVHCQYTTQIPAIQHQDMTIGLTSLAFCRFEPIPMKIQTESPYTPEGRTIHFNRTEKRPLLARVGELYSERLSEFIAFFKANTIYNFEYFLNRAHAYNRDKGKCRICSDAVDPRDLHCHHIDKTLPISRINKIANLASTHAVCHSLIHCDSDLSQFDKKIQTRIRGFRDKVR